MHKVQVHQIHDKKKADLPLFQGLNQKLADVRQRAFDFFQARNPDTGNSLEDWFRAEKEVFGDCAAEFSDIGKAYEMRVTLPGFAAKNVDVTVSPDEVVVHARTNQKHEHSDKSVVWSEFESRDVLRSFQLPGAVEDGTVAATLEDGILRIVAPKVAAVGPVEVKPKAIAAHAA